MLHSRRHPIHRSICWSQPPVSGPAGRAAANAYLSRPPLKSAAGRHPLSRAQENQQLFDYEQRIKSAFDAIVPTLKRVSALQHEEDFESKAQAITMSRLGFELPESLLADAWVEQLDMRSLFAGCVFETYQRFAEAFFNDDPIGNGEENTFQSLLQDCGFHTLDISPCADGRLAHVIRYVLRLPHRAVRRKSYAGALFDIEDSLNKWTETELQRFREGKPNTADAPTRYLKSVVYHYSSSDPNREGCAAHGSDAGRAARAGLDRLYDFQQAVQNSFCCGASIDLMLIGLDTDTDAIRIHLPDQQGGIHLDDYIDAGELYNETSIMTPADAEVHIARRLQREQFGHSDGMVRLMTYLLINNFSQIEYVQQYHGDRYSDIGHAERFIGAGKGFEEIQLRNLTYFAYLDTVEEAAPDLDVGIKIFTRLNISHGLPVPVVVRYDYNGDVPGARERAKEHCRRVANALHERYPDLTEKGLLHTLLVVRDSHSGGNIEVLGSSVNAQTTQEAH